MKLSASQFLLAMSLFAIGTGCDPRARNSAKLNASSRPQTSQPEPSRPRPTRPQAPVEPSRPQSTRPAAPVDPRAKIDPSEGLCESAFEGRLDDVLYFLKRGASPTATCSKYTRTDKAGNAIGVTAIQIVATKKHKSIFKAILETSELTGARPIRHLSGMNVVHLAVLLEDPAILNSLLERSRAGIDGSDDNGVSPLAYALSVEGAHPQLVETLLKHGADTKKLVTAEKLSPLQLALAQGRLEYANLLTKYDSHPYPNTKRIVGMIALRDSGFRRCIDEFQAHNRVLLSGFEAFFNEETTRQCPLGNLEFILQEEAEYEWVPACEWSAAQVATFEEFSDAFLKAMRQGARELRKQGATDISLNMSGCMALARAGTNLTHFLAVAGKART